MGLSDYDGRKPEPPYPTEAELSESNALLGRYEACWFSGVDWAYRKVELLARSEEEVRQWVEKETPRQFRNKPNYGTQDQEHDSLTIRFDGHVDLPFEIAP